MLPVNPLINGHVYNWYESQFAFDALKVSGVLSISGIKEKAEQEPQWGTDREPIGIATGKITHDPITVSMYAFEWQNVKTMLTAKSLGQGWAFASFTFTAMATGNLLEGSPPVGDIWAGCKVTEVGKEYGQDVNGLKVDVTFQPLRHRDLDGMTMSNLSL